MAIAFSNSFQTINEGGKHRVRLLCIVITKCRRTVSSELKNLYEGGITHLKRSFGEIYEILRDSTPPKPQVQKERAKCLTQLGEKCLSPQIFLIGDLMHPLLV